MVSSLLGVLNEATLILVKPPKEYVCAFPLWGVNGISKPLKVMDSGYATLEREGLYFVISSQIILKETVTSYHPGKARALMPTVFHMRRPKIQDSLSFCCILDQLDDKPSILAPIIH